MMFNGFCHFGNWGSFGNVGIWGWAGMILNLVFWVSWLAGLALLVVLLIRRARVSQATVPQPAGRPSAKEILQAQYARGEITREEYELRKQDIR
jgi:putative membrane protein